MNESDLPIVNDLVDARAVILTQHKQIEALTAMLSLRVQSLKIARYEQTLKMVNTIAKALHKALQEGMTEPCG